MPHYITLTEYKQMLKWAEKNGYSELAHKLRRTVSQLERKR